MLPNAHTHLLHFTGDELSHQLIVSRSILAAFLLTAASNWVFDSRMTWNGHIDAGSVKPRTSPSSSPSLSPHFPSSDDWIFSQLVVFSLPCAVSISLTTRRRLWRIISSRCGFLFLVLKFLTVKMLTGVKSSQFVFLMNVTISSIPNDSPLRPTRKQHQLNPPRTPSHRSSAISYSYRFSISY